ncbi:DUF6960 family protein [Variovorax sp. 160MFSha2.1]|uniref:DUF6960 family protein n=1 Tax=Variovorax sp. 160MFSha2.1 TaxID=3158367 RepID=UPI003AAE4753
MAPLTPHYVVCNWFPEHGDHLIAETDRSRFAALSPAGKVFRCIDRKGEWLFLQYAGDEIYRVNQEACKPVLPPVFHIGQRVKASEKQGIVVHIGWHFKNEAPIYLLEFAGKRSSRRYLDQDLAVDEVAT